MMRSVRIAFLLCASLAVAPGCFKSSTSQGSSDSFSDSSGSFSDSSKSSSGERQASFWRDVRAYAARFAHDDAGDVAALQRDLGELARGHGILDWESDDGTWRELGGGFAQAGVGDARFAALADGLAPQAGRRRSLLYAGYAAQRGE
jgi:hypothetical protein